MTCCVIVALMCLVVSSHAFMNKPRPMLHPVTDVKPLGAPELSCVFQSSGMGDLFPSTPRRRSPCKMPRARTCGGAR